MLARSFLVAAILTPPVFVLEMGSHLVPRLPRLGDGHDRAQSQAGIQFVLTTLVLFGPGCAFSARRARPPAPRAGDECARGPRHQRRLCLFARRDLHAVMAAGRNGQRLLRGRGGDRDPDPARALSRSQGEGPRRRRRSSGLWAFSPKTARVDARRQRHRHPDRAGLHRATLCRCARARRFPSMATSSRALHMWMNP